jgi:biotin carboxyl carrier protein
MPQLKVKSEVHGNVWKITAKVGDVVPADEPIVILESMKMEIPVAATKQGKLIELLVAEGQPVEEGQVVAVLETA